MSTVTSAQLEPKFAPALREFADGLARYRQRWPGDGYVTTWQRFVETYRLLAQHYQGGRILDAGGWPGDFSCVLADLGLDVLLLDKDLSRPIAKIQDKATGKWVLDGATTLADRCHEYRITPLQCDIEQERIPLDDASVDFIVFTEVIEHLRIGLLHTLRELYRILKPGGRLLVSTPNLLSLRNRISFLLGRAAYDTLEMPFDALAAEERIGHGGHFRVFSMPELRDLLEKSGFHVVTTSYRQIMFSESEKRKWSFYEMRSRAQNWLAESVASLGNTMFAVATRD